MLVTSIFSFSTVFSTLPKTNFNFSVIFILSSAIALKLDQSRNLSFGKELNMNHGLKEGGLNPFPYKPWFLRVCSTSALKTLRKKEKLLIMSNFSFSHSVFYPFEEVSVIVIKSEIVVCKLFQFGRL